MKRPLLFLCLLLGLSAPSFATQIQLVSLEGFLHYGGGSSPQVSFNNSSPEFTSLLDANNLGSFTFQWINNTGGDLSDVTFTLFIDPDIDRDTNTFFNEYGELIGLVLPIGAPIGALAALEWEIDEPEYVFGNIYTHALAGALDNSTGVPASGPVDDVSHALLFRVAQLLNGQSLSITGTLSLTDAAGLGQFDPDSNLALYVNGYAQLGPAAPAAIPEPATLALTGGALTALAIRRRK